MSDFTPTVTIALKEYNELRNFVEQIKANSEFVVVYEGYPYDHEWRVYTRDKCLIDLSKEIGELNEQIQELKRRDKK